MTEFHADDYGLFPRQSQRILDCCRQGVLGGVSLMPNSPWLDECMQMLDEQGARLQLSVHLNLIEGCCMAPAEHLPLRLDGQAHWQMLPVVFDALMELIEEQELPVRYIRIPNEPLSLYLRRLPRIFPFHPINLVKTAVLRVLSRRALRRHRALLSRMEQKLFLGVLFSDCFDYGKLCLMLQDAETEAARRGMGLELLLHPGAVYEPEDLATLSYEGDRRFLSSPGRQIEAEALRRLAEERLGVSI